MTKLAKDLQTINKDVSMEDNESNIEELDNKSYISSVKSMNIKNNNLSKISINLSEKHEKKLNINCSMLDNDALSTISIDSKHSSKRRYSYRNNENEQEIILPFNYTNKDNNYVNSELKNFETISNISIEKMKTSNSDKKKENQNFELAFIAKKKLDFSKVEMETIEHNNYNNTDNKQTSKSSFNLQNSIVSSEFKKYLIFLYYNLATFLTYLIYWTIRSLNLIR
jgi:hypothetical protein